MAKIHLFLFISLLGFAAIHTDVLAGTVTTTAHASCDALQNAVFHDNSDALTQIIDTKVVARNGETPGYCEVNGYVAPNVNFVLRLPLTSWNGKFIELGCSGECGATDHISECDEPLGRGYACIVSDGGHRSTRIDLEWAYNNPLAMTDYLALAEHVTALAGKMIAERYYSQPPGKSYFMGCSSGGVEGLLEVQKFPWDFDGVIAGAPDLNISGVWINLLWGNRAMTDGAGKPRLTQSDLDLLHQAVVAKCDLNDGVKDGLIGDPRACHFNSSDLLCRDGRKSSQCLTADQIETVNKIYSGPMTSKGEQIVTPVSLLGSEKAWIDWYVGSDRNPTALYNYIGDGFRYYLFRPNPGPNWKPEYFDFDRDYKRLGMAQILEPVHDPDLRRFKENGGKLIVYHSWSDPAAGVLHTVDYYDTVERIVGSREETQDFFRLFVIPGGDHCRGGEGAFAVDYLTALESWVEKGQAPQKLVGYNVEFKDSELVPHWLKFPLDPTKIKFSRPLYPYPTLAKYLGHGDPKYANSFGPVEPQQEYLSDRRSSVSTVSSR